MELCTLDILENSMSIEKIRNTVVDNIGNDVKIIYNEGRNKIYVYRGKVVEVYNNIFIIFDVKYDCKRSFSYYDILTNTVKMSFML
ncbi:MAG: Veg family protein [Bacilli bacterium]|nr:Veg family protein [Bacilli bacterium]